MLIGPDWSLDYKKYTAAELRGWIEARMSTTLSEKERQTIRNCNKYQLANRLHKLDLASTFPRFMELPTELRLSVYELLLVDTRERNSDGMVTNWNSGYRLHPAVLGTSKQIHSEARPILYRKNKFEATIEELEAAPYSSCKMRVVMPGVRIPYSQTMSSSRDTPFLDELFGDPVMGTLRSLTHMTINLSLAMQTSRQSEEYVPEARDAIACLCLSLAGASKMQELTINVDPGQPQERNKVDFARIMWPLVFLRTDIVVKFEGIAEILETSATAPKTVPHAEAFYGRHIAKTRHLCIQEIEKHGTDLVGLRGVESALASMSYFGSEFISMEDIVNLSAAWSGMRSEADRVEAMDLVRKNLLWSLL